MAFTGDEVTNIANAVLDFYIKGSTEKQTLQEKPLLKALMANKKEFPGGKGNISIPVQGAFASAQADFFEGYTHNDTVGFVNPANILRAAYAWKELHCGITMTATELKHDGISLVDTNGESTSNHSDRDVVVLTGLLENKIEDFMESRERALNGMLWADGTQDAKEIPGIKALISHTPTTGTTGGLNRATYSWWRNRAYVGVGTNANGALITSSPTNQTLTKFLRKEVRQLRRYHQGKYVVLAGSGFIEKLEAEIHEKGIYTESGFAKNGTNDIGMADISMRGVGTIVYDPTLDDNSESNFCYFIDTTSIRLAPMSSEWMKKHTPARPHDQFVIYKSITDTGALTAKRLSSSAVYETA